MQKKKIAPFMTRTRSIALPTLAAFRTVALLACAIMLAVALTSSLGMGPARIEMDAALNKPTAMLAMKLAGTIRGTGADPEQAALWFYLGILVLAMSLFAACFWWRTSPTIKRPALLDAGLLAVQILVGALVESNLLHLVAAELAFILPPRAAVAWLCTQMAIFVMPAIPLLAQPELGTPVCNVDGILPPPRSVMIGLHWLEEIAFQIFAYCVGHFAAAEMRTRRTLAEANAELGAAQLLLAETIRTSERERIARDLHDALGQHLSALNIQLDLAMRQVANPIRESVQTAHDLAQRLLTEMRAVVSIERERQPLNLRHALETLCAGIPSPRIVLSFDEKLAIDSPALSHTVFCAIQEAVSNAVRHSGANVLQIVLTRKHEHLTIAISDDGKGVSASEANRAGNGLRGIRERIEEAGGKVETANRAEGGFVMHIQLPLAGGRE